MKSFLRRLWQQQQVKLLVKMLISALALWIVYQRVDFPEVISQIRRTSSGFFLAALGLFNLSQVVSAARLQLFLLQENIRIPFIENLKLYYVGMFYNLLVPGGIGGDGYKAYRFKTSLKIPVKNSVRALLADRVNGAVGLTSLAGLFAVLIPLPQSFHIKIWVALGIILLLFITALAIVEFLKHYVTIWWRSLLYSVFVQGLQTAAAVALLTGLKVPLNVQPVYLFVFLMGSLASAIPVTVGGLGARELIFLFAAEYFFIHTESAITLSVLFYAVTVVSALPGAILRVDMTDKQKITALT